MPDPGQPNASASHQPGKATVCGFSFGRNLTKLNYPVEAAVRSVLPLCDDFVFVVGKSDDDTRERVCSIDPKVRVIDSVWPDVQIDGTVLAIEGNKALSLAQQSGCTWGFYIQADEVVHENDLPLIRAAFDAWADHTEVKALLFRYLHFVFDYETVDPWMYHKASRVVRLDGSCEIVKDACGPGIRNYTGKVHKGDGYLDKHHLGGHVRWATDPALGAFARKAHIYHYGWVKSREELQTKLGMVESLWWGTLTQEEVQRRRKNKYGRLIERYKIMKKFRRTHPAVMRELIAKHPPFAKVINRWLNPWFYAEVLRHGFAG
jgi:hypothetical protein